MNDIGYEKIEYKNSYAYNTVKSLSKEELLYRRGYTGGAIKFHEEENNPCQIKFFTDELNLINKRLKRMEGIN